MIGSIGLDVSRAKPSLVWAIIEADSGGVYRSDDAGATWRSSTAITSIRQRAWYYTRIMRRSESTRTSIYALNVSLMKSTDGGKTFTQAQRAARRQPRPVDRVERRHSA